MPISLYAAAVPTYIQIMGSVAGLIDQAEAFCTAGNLDPGTIIQAKLAEDMFPFATQVKSTWVHSIGGIDALRTGSFSPDRTPAPTTFAGLRDGTAETIAALKALDPAELEGFVGRDTQFVFGEHKMDFVAEDFLLSFSQPNFFFHASAAYAILRMKGVEVGKRNFLGALRLKA